MTTSKWFELGDIAERMFNLGFKTSDMELMTDKVRELLEAYDALKAESLKRLDLNQRLTDENERLLKENEELRKGCKKHEDAYVLQEIRRGNCTYISESPGEREVSLLKKLSKTLEPRSTRKKPEGMY